MSSTTGFWSLESGRAVEVADAAVTAGRWGGWMRRKAAAAARTAARKSRRREAVEGWDAGTERQRRASVGGGASTSPRGRAEMGGDAIAVAGDALAAGLVSGLDLANVSPTTPTSPRRVRDDYEREEESHVSLTFRVFLAWTPTPSILVLEELMIKFKSHVGIINDE
jgi:hypothetical protein